MSRQVFDNILGTIGHTPLVRLNKIAREIEATVYAKVETFNPGHSIKDRMALKMIEDAEKAGLLKPGGTIIEGTSGNTGMGLAIGAMTTKRSLEQSELVKKSHAWTTSSVAPGVLSLAKPRKSYRESPITSTH